MPLKRVHLTVRVREHPGKHVSLFLWERIRIGSKDVQISHYTNRESTPIRLLLNSGMASLTPEAIANSYLESDFVKERM